MAKPKAKEEAPKANAFEVRHVKKSSEFRRFYDRGDLPLCVDFQGASRKVPYRFRVYHFISALVDGVLAFFCVRAWILISICVYSVTRVCV